MTEITDGHKQAFLRNMDNVNKFFPLDIKNIKDKLSRHKTFPSHGLNRTFSAASTKVAEKLHPFQAEVVLRDSPNYLSQTEPLIELAIIDGRIYDWIKSKLTLSIFPGYRMRLQAFNITLDNKEQCWYDPANTLVDDKLEYKDHPELLKLVRDLISHFPMTNTKNRIIQKLALDGLDLPGNEENYLARKKLEQADDILRQSKKRTMPI